MPLSVTHVGVPGRKSSMPLLPPRRSGTPKLLQRRCRPRLGAFVEIAADSLAAIEAGFAAIDTVHRLMSRQDPHSELSRLNRTGTQGWVRLHDWTAEVLERALF